MTLSVTDSPLIIMARDKGRVGELLAAKISIERQVFVKQNNKS